MERCLTVAQIDVGKTSCTYRMQSRLMVSDSRKVTAELADNPTGATFMHNLQPGPTSSRTALRC